MTVRGVYDGASVKLLPAQPLPVVDHEVPVEIVFLDDEVSVEEKRQRQWEAARRMLAARDAMEPLGMPVKDLIEEGRER